MQGREYDEYHLVSRLLDVEQNVRNFGTYCTAKLNRLWRPCVRCRAIRSGVDTCLAGHHFRALPE